MSTATAPNLTRVHAAERAALLSISNYAIALDLTDGSNNPSENTFRSTTTVTFTATAGASTFIDLITERIHSVILNGTPVDFSAYTPETGIALPGLAAENSLTIDANFNYSNTGEGLHRFVDPTDGEVYLYSQFETADAKRVFACFDQPDLKATYDVSITAPAHWQVITNGALVSTNGLVRTFATTELLSTYLIAVIAGPYAVWTDTFTDSNGSIDLGLFCRASLKEFMDAERLFTETKQGFAFYHKNFGIAYPFGKYDQLFVPEFNAGAMENAGAVTFLEDYVFRSKVTKYMYERRAETVLHEMAHMWFGDLVTMQWWDDLWLNESFATFASVLCQAEATEYTNAWTTFANVEKSWAYRQDQLPSTHPIAADIPDVQAVEVNFDGITYAKGASVLKQLVAYVGLEPFLAGLRDYFAQHKFGNATFADLLAALEKSSGRDLSDWGNQWLKTTGINALAADFDVDTHGNFTRFDIVQSGATPGAGELRVHRLAVGIYDDDAGKLLRINRIELDISAERTPVPELIGAPSGLLILVNDDDLTYCSVNLDPASLAVAIDRIADISDPMARTLIWSATWEMTRDATLRARDFIALVERGIGAETEIGVVQRVLLQAQTALDRYADPTWASETGWPRFTSRLLELAQSAQPGSDYQLAFVNSLLSSVLSTAHLDICEALLSGTDPAQLGLAGLTVDTDLRWSIVKALATAGRIDTNPDASETIDAELARDTTAAGERNAATARAARPLADAKTAAWAQAMTDDTASNSLTRAVVAGFIRPGQAELVESFTADFFATAPLIWERRSSEVAQTVIVGLYPQWSISEESLALADALLAQDNPAAFARLISEGRDTVARSLRIRNFDRS